MSDFVPVDVYMSRSTDSVETAQLSIWTGPRKTLLGSVTIPPPILMEGSLRAMVTRPWKRTLIMVHEGRDFLLTLHLLQICGCFAVHPDLCFLIGSDDRYSV